MAFKRPPRGYQRDDQPLPHNLKVKFSLGMETKNETYVPLILNDEGLVNPDAVNVNPKHASFAESDNPYCYHGSIIPKMNITIKARLSKAGVETDKVQELEFYWMPVYTSFLNRLEAQDSKSAAQVEDILELQHETVGKSVYPIWSGTKLTGHAGDIKIHATPTTALMGLSTTDALESIAFSDNLFYDALQYYTNSSMLKKVIGRMHRVRVRQDKMYVYHSNNFTNSMVKRINDYTFCGILFDLPLGTDSRQLIEAGDTTDINHLHLSVFTRYEEWNNDFDQTAT